LHFLRRAGQLVAGIAFPLSKRKIRQDTAHVILPAERKPMVAHLRRRHKMDARVNVNFLGEAVLGENEAARRLEQCLEALALPEVEVLSIKISTLYSQVSPLAFNHTVEVLCSRLEKLFRAAAEQNFVRPNGDRVPKFVYLDMEEYRDMHLTAAAFMRTLEISGMKKVSAGIVLQAYLPDAFAMQQQLNTWARDRVAAGGAPIRLRIVKGANMEMERIEAALNGWPQAPFNSKVDTDANFKRMIHEALQEENLAAVRPGIGSHNLFDIAYGLVLAKDAGARNRVRFEMLEGMANHQRRALADHAENILLYAPACREEDFINAIGYLIRRLDENTGPDNFLRHAFHISVGDPEWERMEKLFQESVHRIEGLPSRPNRRQDRRLPPKQPKLADDWREFANEPDTDFSLPHHTEWAREIIAKWKPRCGEKATHIPLTIAGERITAERELIESTDPSRLGTVVVRAPQANADDLHRAVACAKADPAGWCAMPMNERRTILTKTAQEMREARANLIGAAMADGGKLVTEADAEV
ncbi:MAG: bifunctional proline dehydrogenase/L-glutamate gamma-semialdehyde dehydrogenase, partial [Pedosphaera sp.]|nr:bifunctional proline dehydrogenase/L-glutamate gamma-semialdehyde dehydrogenase [Pedosphaera sp.]